jgi:plasmid maintenance system antidote protein VapI
METQKINLRELIIKVYEEKRARNSAYTMRALARDLDLDPGQLHRIIKLQMKATPLVAFKVGKSLKFESEHVLKLIEDTL